MEKEKTKSLLSEEQVARLVKDYPIYSQEDKGADAVALYHLTGVMEWYILEGSREGEGVTLFGLTVGRYTEMGYFSLNELNGIVETYGSEAVSLDTNFEAQSLRDIPDEGVKEYLRRMNFI